MRTAAAWLLLLIGLALVAGCAADQRWRRGNPGAWAVALAVGLVAVAGAWRVGL